MNIVKLQNELRSVPDQALVGYVQNPTGQVPTYLALTELQRRKEMREQYQKEAPQKSVAESLIEESIPQPPMQQGIASVAPQQQAPQPQAPMPQAPQGMAGGGMVSFGDGGVASLDTGDMYNEENFATGGIVAFGDGGEVPGYAKGKYIMPSDYDPESYWKRAEAQLKSNVGVSGLPATKYMNIKTPYDAAIDYYNSLGTPEALNARDKLQMEKYKWLRSSGDPTEQMSETGMGSNLNKLLDSSVKTDTKPATQNKPAMDNKPAPVATKKDDNVIDFTNKTDNKVAPAADTNSDIDTLMGINTYKKRPEDISEGKRAMQEFNDLIGTNEFSKLMQTRLNAKEAEFLTEKEKAPWMALAEAGFSMMGGKSPHALQNVSEGALTGLKSYAEAKKDLNKTDDKIFDLQSKIYDAQRQEQLAAAKYGTDSMQYNKAANDRYDLEKEKQILEVQKYKYLDPSRSLTALMTQSNNREAMKEKMRKDAGVITSYLYLNENGNDPNTGKPYNDEMKATIRTMKARDKAIEQELNKAYPISTDPNVFRSNAPNVKPVNPFLYGSPIAISEPS